MKCSELKPNDQVVCKVKMPMFEEKQPIDGTVVELDTARRIIWVCYLFGYQSYTEPIAYEDMLAVYNKNGEYMKFANISGPSLLLTAN